MAEHVREGGPTDRDLQLVHPSEVRLRSLAWSVLLLPIGTFGFTVAVSLWSTALALVTSPLWYWAMPDDDEIVQAMRLTRQGTLVHPKLSTTAR